MGQLAKLKSWLKMEYQDHPHSKVRHESELGTSLVGRNRALALASGVGDGELIAPNQTLLFVCLHQKKIAHINFLRMDAHKRKNFLTHF